MAKDWVTIYGTIQYSILKKQNPRNFEAVNSFSGLFVSSKRYSVRRYVYMMDLCNILLLDKYLWTYEQLCELGHSP
jgi:hypothetical protein